MAGTLVSLLAGNLEVLSLLLESDGEEYTRKHIRNAADVALSHTAILY